MGQLQGFFWNLNQSIEHKIKDLQLEKCRYITDIKNNVLGHCTVFSVQAAKIFIWKKSFQWLDVGCIKRGFKKNKYCDLFFMADSPN